LNQEEEAGVGGQAAGHSLVTYNPSLFELTEDGGMGAPSPGKLQTPSPAHGGTPLLGFVFFTYVVSYVSLHFLVFLFLIIFNFWFSFFYCTFT